MNTVIAVSGHPNSGKTTTIRKLFESVKELCDLVEDVQLADVQNGEFRYADENDFVGRCLIRIEGRGDVFVGFVSGGDNKQAVNDGFEKLDDMGPCEIIVCAMWIREYGQTVKAVRKQARKRNYPVRKICKPWVEDKAYHEIENKEFAGLLKSVVCFYAARESNLDVIYESY